MTREVSYDSSTFLVVVRCPLHHLVILSVAVFQA